MMVSGKGFMKLGNLMIVQGGGPTAVFNASLAGVIGAAMRESPSSRIYGARSGTVGMAQGDFVELGGLSAGELGVLERTPGAALGSSRFKPTAEDVERQVEHLRRLEIRSILFMGGNGTMRGAELTSARCREAGLDVQVIGIPKTVDNDIAITDRCPGYASAARFVAQSTRELGLDVQSLRQPVTILETMGRSVGWLAAAAVAGMAHAEDAPQLVYVPETAFEEGAFLAALDDIVARKGWAVVVVAEGIRKQDGSLVYEIADPAQQDALKRNICGGVSQHLAGVVASKLKMRCRSEKPGLLGRASMALVAEQDFEDAGLVGRAAVEALRLGLTEQMVALRPLHAGEAGGYDMVALGAVAGVERPIPAEWLTDGPLAVSDEFRRYLQPMVGEFAPIFPGFGLPVQEAGVS
jgi:6-phosphofructokinase